MGDATRPTVVIDTMQNAFCDDETTLRLMLGTRELGCYCVVENLSAEAASLQAVADAIYDAGRDEARAELERLRAENASLRAGTIRTDSGAVIAALEAENASLRAARDAAVLAVQAMEAGATICHWKDAPFWTAEWGFDHGYRHMEGPLGIVAARALIATKGGG